MHFPFLWKYSFHWVDFWCVHPFQLLNVCNQYVTLQVSPRAQSVSKEQSRKDFLSKLMDSWLVFRRDRLIFNQGTKRNDWSFKWFSQTLFVWSFSIRQKILNVSQIGVTRNRICRPIFIQTWLQQYGRCTFFHSAHCSLSNPVCFRSVWCRRTLIPGKIFTGFANFQEIVSVNDFRLRIRPKKLLQAPLCFLRSFIFARIRLDPLGSQVLHHDCTLMIVSRFTTFTENFVIYCNQITKIFLHEIRLLQCVFCTEPLYFWSSGRSRNFGL